MKDIYLLNTFQSNVFFQHIFSRSLRLLMVAPFEDPFLLISEALKIIQFCDAFYFSLGNNNLFH